jgi:hypothetical protein
MKEIFNIVLEKMDEMEFLKILSWASIKAIITMAILLAVGYFFLPTIAEGNANFFVLTFIATFLIFYSVFKVDYHDFWRFALYTAISFLYGSMTYLFGELIYIGLVAAGILLVVIFLAGDATLTGVYTYRDLKKWVITQTEQEQKKKEKEEARILKLSEIANINQNQNP